MSGIEAEAATGQPVYGVCYTETIEEHHGHGERDVYRQRCGVVRDLFWFDSVSAATKTPAEWAAEIILDLAPQETPVWVLAPATAEEMHHRLEETFRHAVELGGIAADPLPLEGPGSVPSIHVAYDYAPVGMSVGSRTERGEEVSFASMGGRSVALVGAAWNRADIVEVAGLLWQPAEILVSRRCGPCSDEDPPANTAWFDAISDELFWPVFDDDGDMSGRERAEAIWGADWVNPS